MVSNKLALGSSTYSKLSLVFWGTRGSIPVSGKDYVRYGGNTPCVELTDGENIIILDAGSGIKELGNQLVLKTGPLKINIFLSHLHLDHIQGLPFFSPLYRQDVVIKIYCGLRSKHKFERSIERLLTHPLAPNLMPAIKAAIEYLPFKSGATLEPFPNCQIETGSLHHPGGSVGFRINWLGKSVTYITDHEHSPKRVSSNVMRLAKQCSVLIYDACYSATEFLNRKGWGHSTFEEGMHISKKARVEKTYLFHHDPSKTDEMLDAIANNLEKSEQPVYMAYDGLRVAIGKYS